MRTISLRVNKVDKKTLADNNIEIQFLEDVLTLVINALKPSSRNIHHIIKLNFDDIDCSIYQFEDRLTLTRRIFYKRDKNSMLMYFFSDLFHEFAHYIQYKIDKVKFSKFAVDHDRISFTTYYNNPTERQARRYGNIAKEILSVYKKMNRLKKAFATNLNSNDERPKKTRREKNQENSQEATQGQIST